ncbi:MAG: CBS domain-containing protein [Candidatus Omnitrophica bacterium]|nr:CBS domain-containing protein [Candidatus Omnitrophota bacterium]MDD5553219.1 CBS domain-containing protein [Candidatus Omnitrophota bacterium]
MKVKEIMIKDVTSISPDLSADEALSLLEKMSISGLPVIDKEGRLVGMFTEKDVLSHILPSYIQQVGKFIYEENPKSTRKKFSELSKIKVSQIMRKEVITTKEDVTLCEVARIMLTQKARRLPVLDNSGKVVGIVARVDILKAFAREAESAPQGRT